MKTEGFSDKPSDQSTAAFNIDINSLPNAYDDNNLDNAPENLNIYTAQMLDSQYAERKLIKSIIYKKNNNLKERLETAQKNYDNAVLATQFSSKMLVRSDGTLNDDAMDFEIGTASHLAYCKKILDEVINEYASQQNVIRDVNNLYRMAAEQENAQKMLTLYGNPDDGLLMTTCLTLDPSPG